MYSLMVAYIAHLSTFIRPSGLWLSHDAYATVLVLLFQQTGMSLWQLVQRFVLTGLVPLAQGQQGWQTGLTFGVIATALS